MDWLIYFFFDFSVQLSPCEVEVDISIMDRITALFNRPSFLNSPKSKFSQMYQVFILKTDRKF